MTVSHTRFINEILRFLGNGSFQTDEDFKLEMINLSDHEYVHEELRQRAKSIADAWPNVSGSELGSLVEDLLVDAKRKYKPRK
ncbi:hypothetical protein [Alteromonas gilva]|uniref:Uncharacterized protein n=1 Tax=Alteromonas gilva TaxID=2987522 RepID=A0ABT5L6Z3_9ALTE|nr:hypothetical protein [Alteromonas gilva]MDC8832815.1 hypothetical protein [Alteromonas gilva]